MRTSNEDRVQKLQLHLTKVSSQLHTYMLINDEHFDDMKQKLNAILEQTTKTNGRVRELELWRAKHDEGNCVINDELKEVRESLLEYNFFRKYPKALVIIITVATFMLVVNTFIILKSLIL